MNANIKAGWKEKTDEINRHTKTENNTKPHIKERINATFKEEIEKTGASKSKVQYLIKNKQEEWGVGKRHPYLNELTRNQASALFKARTRMIRAKNNERGAHQNEDQLTCRFCEHEEIETQQHLLEHCPAIHKDDKTKITMEEIFAQYDAIKSRATAEKIINIIKLIEKKGEEKKERKEYTGKKYPCVQCHKPCKENQNSIECDECKKWTHLKCTELTNEQFSKLSEKPEETWDCQKCTIIKQAQDGNIRLAIQRNNNKEWTCQPTPGLTIVIRKDHKNELRCHHKTTVQHEPNRNQDKASEKQDGNQRTHQARTLEPGSRTEELSTGPQEASDSERL